MQRRTRKTILKWSKWTTISQWMVPQLIADQVTEHFLWRSQRKILSKMEKLNNLEEKEAFWMILNHWPINHRKKFLVVDLVQREALWRLALVRTSLSLEWSIAYHGRNNLNQPSPWKLLTERVVPWSKMILQESKWTKLPKLLLKIQVCWTWQKHPRLRLSWATKSSSLRSMAATALGKTTVLAKTKALWSQCPPPTTSWVDDKKEQNLCFLRHKLL